MNPHDEKQPKKEYYSPKLVEYGSVGEITQNAGMNNAADGNTTGNTKTS